MANSVAIPQDIIHNINIIEAVGNDRRLLKNCALVSSLILLPSRKHLFSQIYLNDNHPSCERLHKVLVENPVILSFVRSMAVIGHKTFNSHSLIAILRLPFCCLESFSINIRNWPANWNDFSSEPKDALSTIIHSSTLKTLYLDNISVLMTLFHGIHLRKLELRSLLLDDIDDEQLRLMTSAASEGVATTASYPVIDQCVWFSYMPIHGPTNPIFLSFMCRLRVFEIYVSPPSAMMSDFENLSFLIHSLRVSLTSPATLEHLKIDIAIEGKDNQFNSYGLFDDLRDADFWSHLDSIITHPTGSRLQRVNINIKYAFRYDDDVKEPDETEIMEPFLDALPLLREKGILFVEANVA